MKGSPVPLANPILLAPSSTSEACLRIQQGLKGAKAEGRVVQIPLTSAAVLEMYETGRPPSLASYEFFSVDVSEFYRSVSTNPDGTPKNPTGTRSGENFGAVEYSAWLESPQREAEITERAASIKTDMYTPHSEGTPLKGEADDAVELFDTGDAEEPATADDKVDAVLAALSSLLKSKRVDPNL